MAIDTTFGTNGSTATPFFGGYNQPAALGLELLAGDALSAGGTLKVGDAGAEDLAIARYTANGVLDTTFASGGLSVTQFPGGMQNAVASTALGPHGLVLDALGRKPTADGGSEPVMDLGPFVFP